MFKLNRRLMIFLIRLFNRPAVRAVFFIVGVSNLYAGLKLWATQGLTATALLLYYGLLIAMYWCFKLAAAPSRTQQDETQSTPKSGTDPAKATWVIDEALRILAKDRQKRDIL